MVGTMGSNLPGVPHSLAEPAYAPASYTGKAHLHTFRLNPFASRWPMMLPEASVLARGPTRARSPARRQMNE